MSTAQNLRQSEILVGDCRDVLATLDAGSVQTCVTSPPYFGLRDYGTGEWEGGEPDCDHRMKNPEVDARTSTLGPARAGLAETNTAYQHGKAFRESCGKCGAVRKDQQIGLEPTPDEFVAALVGAFREVRRVLADDGTLWLNLGDSYAGSWGAQSRPPGETSTLVRNGGTGPNPKMLSAAQIAAHPKGQTRTGSVPPGADYKAKDLFGIPWMVAFALRADGWYLRSDIIWHKPNPMPESVTDRPTKAHEYLFLLSKGPRYYYDAAAIAEPAAFPEGPGNVRPVKGAEEDPEKMRTRANAHLIGARETRSKRTVWTVTSSPYSGAHFATFPPKLIEPCIRAGSREGDTVLDPFNGAGTTGLVAQQNGRSYIGIELNPEYAALTRDRLNGVNEPLPGMAA